MMIIEDIKKIKSGKKELREFGLIVGLVLGLLGGLLWWRGRDIYPFFLTVSVALILSGLIVPAALKPLQKIWMTAAVILGWVMTRLILIILFYLVLTPIGLLGRLLGKSFLDSKFRTSSTSYWIPKAEKETEKSEYEKQF
ncbi:MAG: hypothetical protein HY758_07645 [Nitrospirae bacterium]|nr:hypothetical protein [Nitrospirota bacterium]